MPPNIAALRSSRSIKTATSSMTVRGSTPPIERLIEDVDVDKLIGDGEFPTSDSHGQPVYEVPAAPEIWYPWDQTEMH